MWLRKESHNAFDNIHDPSCHVVVGDGHVLHARRFHSPPAHPRNRHGVDSSHSRAKRRLVGFFGSLTCTGTAQNTGALGPELHSAATRLVRLELHNATDVRGGISSVESDLKLEAGMSNEVKTHGFL